MEINRKQTIGIISIVIILLTIVGLGTWHFAKAGFQGPEPSVPKYLETTLPCSYVVDTNGTTTFCYNSTTWKLEWSSSSNRSLPAQNAIDLLTASDGGLIFTRSGNYSDASVTVKSNVVMVLEVGVTGLSYTTTGTGIVMKYASGYAILEAPLNMTQHQIIFGVFHSGSTKPSSPTEAQFFYDTDDHALFIWNGTDWEDYSQAVQGAQGPQGPAGLGGLGDYTFIVYQNGTNTQYRNSTGILLGSDTDDDKVTNWALANLTTDRTWKETVKLKGFFNVDSKLRIKNRTILDITEAILNNTGATDSMIENYDTTNGNRFIEIKGGEIDWNYGGSSPKVIHFVKASDSVVRDTYIHEVTTGSDSYAIQYDTCLRSNVEYCMFDDIKSGGIIFIRGCVACDMIECKTTNFGTGSGVSAPYLIFGYEGDEPTKCNIIECYADQGSLSESARCAGIYRYARDCKIVGGTYYVTDAFGSAGIYIGHPSYKGTTRNCGAFGVTIVGKGATSTIGATIYDNVTLSGLKIRNCYTGIYWDYGTQLITGNYIENCSNAGISSDVNIGDHSLIEGNIVEGATLGTTIGIGIYGGDANRISNNVVHGTTKGIEVYSGVTNTMIEGNTLVSCTTDFSDLGATNTIWGVGNVIDGLPCDQTVSFSSISNGTYVAHGLAGTPDETFITLSVNAHAWYGTRNSTHVQIYGSVATLSGSMYNRYKP